MEQADILIAGDASVAGGSLSGKIMLLGHRVVGTAASGEEALRQVIENQPEIVVMDIEAMSPQEAIEAATCIHQIFNTPVIFVISAGDDQARAFVAVAEPSGILSRPFSDADLQHTLDEAIYSDQIYAGKAKGPKPARRLTYRKSAGKECEVYEPVVPLRRILC